VIKELGIHSDTVDAVCRMFCDARDACFPRTPRFRSFRKNLDFVPFSTFKRPAKRDGAKLTVLGRTYHLWLSRPLPENGKPKSWEFSTDARGRYQYSGRVARSRQAQRAVRWNRPRPERRGRPVERLYDRGAAVLPAGRQAIRACLSSAVRKFAPGRRRQRLPTGAGISST